MKCKFYHKIQDFLDEKLDKEEMLNMEKHINECPHCQKKLDQVLDEPLPIKGKLEEISDEVLVEKIIKRKKGRRRMVGLGLLGFILGFFSRFYTLDSFIVTKAIMALPYKLAQFCLGIFFSNNILTHGEMVDFSRPGGMGYFPFHPLLDFIASSITPALIASFGMIVLGYLFSEKRFFRKKEIINFLLASFLIMVIWVGSLFLIYNHTEKKIASFQDINNVIIYEMTENSSSWLIHIDKEGLQDEKYRDLVVALEKAEQEGRALLSRGEGLGFLIGFSGGGEIFGFLDLETGELTTLNKYKYKISPEYLNKFKDLKEAQA